MIIENKLRRNFKKTFDASLIMHSFAWVEHRAVDYMISAMTVSALKVGNDFKKYNAGA